jgi:hypothetical protein
MLDLQREWRSKALRLAIVGAALVIAGCGDGYGYDVLVDNRSTADVVVTVESTVDRSNRSSFIAHAGSVPAATSWTYLLYSDDGFEPGTVSVFTTDCDPIAEYSVEAGSHVITVEEAGSSIAVHDGHLDADTPDLPVAPNGCP